jgi:O-antigen/teichoic acid export membrane protein
MELKQKALNGIVWSGAQIWGGQVISFIVLLVLTRLIKPESFGLVAYASVFIAFIQMFLDQGFGDAIVQRAVLERGHLDTAFWTNLLTGILLTIACYASSGLIADFFHQPQLTPVLHWLSISLTILGLCAVQQAILRRKLDFKKLALRSLIASIAGGIVGVVLAIMGFGVWSLVAQTLTNAFVGLLVLWNVSSWRPRFYFSKNYFKDLFSFGSNIVGVNFLNFLNRHLDDILIGYFLGPTALGFYTIAYKLLRTMTSGLTGVTNAVAFPAFSRLQNDPKRMRDAFYRAVQYTSLISFPAFIAVAVLAPELIPTLYGPNWYPSIAVIQVLAFIGVLHSVFFFNASVLLAAGRPSWRLGVAIMNAISNMIAFSIAVRWGIVAVAAAYVIRGYVLAPVEIWVVEKAIGLNIKLYLRQFFVPLASSAVMVFAILGLRYLLSTAVVFQLMILGLVGGAVYLSVVQLIMPSIRRQVAGFLGIVLPQWF